MKCSQWVYYWIRIFKGGLERPGQALRGSDRPQSSRSCRTCGPREPGPQVSIRPQGPSYPGAGLSQMPRGPPRPPLPHGLPMLQRGTRVRPVSE